MSDGPISVDGTRANWIKRAFEWASGAPNHVDVFDYHGIARRNPYEFTGNELCPEYPENPRRNANGDYYCSRSDAPRTYWADRSKGYLWNSGIVGFFAPYAFTPSVEALHQATGASEPAVTLDSVTSPAARRATLSGTVDPSGWRTTYRFEYGTTTAYGASAPVPDGNAGSGTGGVSVSQTVSGLRPATTYHYRVVASNRVGTTASADRTFTTAPLERPALFTGDGFAHVFSTTAAERLIETVNNGPDPSDLWRAYDLSAQIGRSIVGEPALLFDGRYVHIYARGTDGSLIEVINHGPSASDLWRAYDLSALTGKRIAGDPAVFNDGRYVHVYARGTDGSLIETISNGPSASDLWRAYDLSALTGKRIAGDPAVFNDGRYVHLYARGTGGALIETISNGPTPEDQWRAYDLSAQTGRTIAGDPAVFFDGTYVHLYARDAGGALIETINLGPSPSDLWRAYTLPGDAGA